MTSLHTLHILNKTPDHPRFSECMGTLGPDDALALTENGVLGVSASANLKQFRVYALEPDLEARGLADQKLHAKTIDYADLVNLTLQAERVISW